MNENKFDQENVFGLGNPSEAYEQYFIGKSFLNPLAKTEGGIGFSNVTFELGCRNNWRVHHAKTGGGKVLPRAAGLGYDQEE